MSLFILEELRRAEVVHVPIIVAKMVMMAQHPRQGYQLWRILYIHDVPSQRYGSRASMGAIASSKMELEH